MDKQYGLTSPEAEKLLKQFGLNTLPQQPPASDPTIIVRQLTSPLVYILFLASLISFFIKDIANALIILLAVGVNTSLGFIQERRAARSLHALKQIVSPQARVIRDGVKTEIEARFLVPGDLVVVSQGDKIPADADVVGAENLYLNEAILTGESMPVPKQSSLSAVPFGLAQGGHSSQLGKTTDESSANYQLPTTNSRVFMGTIVTSGFGKILVTKTGLGTELGKIADTLKTTSVQNTPLQERLRGLSKFLSILVGVIAVFVFTSGIIAGRDWQQMFTTSVAIAVAAIPEGMMVALTVILALGMQRILKRQALVRNLVAAETLGSVTVIATDKTGTLTEGKLRVVKVETQNQDLFKNAAVLANNLLDPLEVALWEWVQKTGIDPQKIRDEKKPIKILPFEPHEKVSVTFYEDEVFVLGAPEKVLSICKEPEAHQKILRQKFEDWGRAGYRLIGLAGSNKPHIKEAVVQKLTKVKNLDWIGLVGFEDPVRQGVKEALEDCRQAGISVKVVTGDYRFTAESVMHKLGINITHAESQIIEGEEVENLSEEDLFRRVESVLLFARVTPRQKLKIVEALKKRSQVVALVGDGVNDAPALKRADIGIVVAGASDVARETADMVLLDANFATIVAAVEEGRGIFLNIKKVILYLLSNSFAEVILVFGAIILGLPLPVTAAQILWVNIISDSFPSLALTFEPKPKGLLKRKPIASGVPLMDSGMKIQIGLISAIVGLISLVVFGYSYRLTGELMLSRSVTFATLGLGSLVYIFGIRHFNKPLWRENPFSNNYVTLAVLFGVVIQVAAVTLPVLRPILDTQTPSAYWWAIVITSSLCVVGLVEVVKLLFNRKNQDQSS